MEMPTRLNRRYVTVAGFLLVAVWCWVAFDRPYIFPEHVDWNIYSNSPESPTTDVFGYPPAASSAMRKVCAKTYFNSSIIFSCNESAGNVADVRNSILHCVRYAILGGGSLIVPNIIGAEDIGGLTSGKLYNLEYMFDTAHFLASLKLSCPQLKVFTSIDETPRQPGADAPTRLQPESIATNEGGRFSPLEWKASLNKWLGQYRSSDAQGPFFVELGRSYLQYPISEDGSEFVQDFGKILRFRADTRKLATTALVMLSATYAPKMLIKEPVIHKAFLGAYLSTQDGGLPSQDPERTEARFTSQQKAYLQQAVESNLTTIYLASDNEVFIPRFISSANESRVTTTTKFDMLKGKDREDLLAMSTEQQVLVDFLVLSKASEFAGVGTSSLAWNIALMRRLYSEQEVNWLDTKDGLLSDELSRIHGSAGSHPEFIAGMWP